MGKSRPLPPASGRPGEPLPPTLRHRLETSLGRDLSHIRVHQDHGANMLGAQAYTTGDSIHIAVGRTFIRDEALLAHETAHTVQQHGTALAPGLVEGRDH